MIRSLLGGSALLCLVVAGLTWGQAGSPSTKSPDKSADKPATLTVQEAGKSPQVCRILKVWSEPNGCCGYQVQALDTGERMSVIEAVPAGPKPVTGTRTVATRVYRYGTSPTPPPGVPVPPASARVLATPTTTPPPAVTHAPAASPYAALPTPTTTVAAKPIEPKPSVQAPARAAEKPADWRQSWGRVEQMPATAPTPQGGTPGSLPVARKQTDPLTQPDAYTKLPTKVEQVVKAPSPTPALLAGESATKQQPTTLVPIQPGTLPAPTPTPAPLTIKKQEPRGLAALFAPRPAAPANKTPPPTPTVPRPVETTTPPLVGMALPPITPIPVTTQQPTPQVRTQPTTPPVVCNPVVPCQPAGTPRLAPTVPSQQPVVCNPAAPCPPLVTARPTPTPTVPVQQPQQPPVTVKPQPALASKPPAVTAEKPVDRTPPPGSRSIHAVNARELREMPEPPLFGPDGRPLYQQRGNAFSEPVVAERNLPEGLANAFTPAMNGRPIPADMMRKDLMPPELVAMMEGRYRPKNGPAGPFAPPTPPGMMPVVPVQEPVVQAPRPVQPVVQQQPAPIQQVSGAAIVDQLSAVLREALLPSEREQAADQLARYEAYRVPTAVNALLHGAMTDPAVMVRIACVRGLGTMRAATPEVLTGLQNLSREGDERVRAASGEVLNLLRVAK